MIAALLLSGVALVAAGAPLCLVGLPLRAGLMLQAVGAALFGSVGLYLLASHGSLGRGFAGALRPRLGVDPLSGVFLAVIAASAAPALVYATRYFHEDRRDRAVAALTGVFVLALALVVCARDPLTFLLGWELMSLVPAAIILIAKGLDRAARRTVFVYLAVTHLGGAGTWVAVLLLAHAGALDGHVVATGSGLQVGVALAALVGMGTKAGVVPFHAWLPRAHPLAPAPISALMSGVMIKVAFYGLIRVLVQWDGVQPVWLGCFALAVGALTALAGIVYALFQRDLKRLLAFSSIENAGIALLALGASVVLHTKGADGWAAFALAASLLHVLNHALFKSLLFLAAGSIERAVGGPLDLDHLGGILRRMPWTGGAFLVGAVSIAGLPPLNGFASEWLTLQALLHVPRVGGVATGLVGAIALGALALTVGLAILCFAKVVGLVLLGPPRRDGVAAAVEVPVAMRAAPVALAAGCVVLGVAPGFVFGSLAATAPWGGAAATQIGLSLPGTGSLPTLGIAVALAGLTGFFAVVRGRRRAAPAPVWASGQPVGAELLYTSAGFTKPLRLVLEGVLRPRREVTVRVRGGLIQDVSYSGFVPQLIETHLYRPALRLALDAAALARRLQSGDVGVYAAYLAGLVVVVLAAVRIGLIG